MKILQTSLAFIILFFISTSLKAQIPSGVYFSENENETHELKINDNYIIHTVYESSPAKFIMTAGGFYTLKDGIIHVDLEFDSDFAKDSLTELDIPYSMNNGKLLLKASSELEFEKSESLSQELDGEWLFATRGPDTGQERRGEESARKTLKFLKDGRFQWIAYHTETMKFSGSGGGTFSSKNGVYVENIEFFSKDNSRVGAELKFDYEIKGKDWHHTGLNSKGQEMYEIWGKR
ncbi:hypothetical protein [Portibacter lacus]|uniref:Membrane or secreted protein n=1 Tax=Portibacter lacus TaxID=1099794 RepID=A0AA37WGL4_9BACT|nr:hypothetical protein [Portibacter lacus]GLR18015.1 hypothetical protein GCM10007940_26300 [Portibacter lacus]